MQMRGPLFVAFALCTSCAATLALRGEEFVEAADNIGTWWPTSPPPPVAPTTGGSESQDCAPYTPHSPDWYDCTPEYDWNSALTGVPINRVNSSHTTFIGNRVWCCVHHTRPAAPAVVSPASPLSNGTSSDNNETLVPSSPRSNPLPPMNGTSSDNNETTPAPMAWNGTSSDNNQTLAPSAPQNEVNTTNGAGNVSATTVEPITAYRTLATMAAEPAQGDHNSTNNHTHNNHSHDGNDYHAPAPHAPSHDRAPSHQRESPSSKHERHPDTPSSHKVDRHFEILEKSTSASTHTTSQSQQQHQQRVLQGFSCLHSSMCRHLLVAVAIFTAAALAVAAALIVTYKCRSPKTPEQEPIVEWFEIL